MIWYRFIEFGFGIIASKYYVSGKEIPQWLRGNMGFIFSFAVAYTGRLLMTTDVLHHFGKIAFVLRAFGEPILTMGFALMILNLVRSESIFKRILSMRLFLFLGRISYSMYLWHWIIAGRICFSMIDKYDINIINFWSSFLLVVIIIIPVSYLSYKWLEEPYFKKTHKSIKLANAGL
jgi:peptidoglycan/LPS O-acetylase OafA/YrhL